MTLINGRPHQSHTHVPKHDKSRDERANSELYTYHLSPDELERYRAMKPPVKDDYKPTTGRVRGPSR